MKLGNTGTKRDKAGQTRASAPSAAPALLELIATLSRISAFTGTNETLAKSLGRSLRTMSRCLKWLGDHKRIVRLRKPTYWYKAGGDPADPRRVIYIVASRDDEIGALQVAHLARAHRRRAPLTEDQFCGRLQCAPKQYARWLKVAMDRKWVTIRKADGGRVVTARARLPSIKLPAVPTKKVIKDGKVALVSAWKAPPKDRLRQTLLDLLDAKLKPMGVIAVTDDQLLRHPSIPVGTARSTVQEKFRLLCEEGRYHRYPLPPGYGKGRLICDRPTDPEALANYAALLFPGRLKPQPRRRPGRPRSAGPRLRVRDVQRRLGALALQRGAPTSSIKVSMAEIASARTALGLNGPDDSLDMVVEMIAEHLLAARTVSGKPVILQAPGSPPGASRAPADTKDEAQNFDADQPVRADGKVRFTLVDPFTGADTIVGEE